MHSPAPNLRMVIVTASLMLSSLVFAKESIVEFCENLRGQYLSTPRSDPPKFDSTLPPILGISNLEYLDYHGRSVPIISNAGLWMFVLSNEISVLGQNGPGFSYFFTPSNEEYSVQFTCKLTEQYGLPCQNLGSIELLRRALTLDVGNLVCDASDVQKTVNSYSALFAKLTTFLRYDRVYPYLGGLLGYSSIGQHESWKYVFPENGTGKLYEIQMNLEIPENYVGEYSSAGFAIMESDQTVGQEMSGPTWIRSFIHAVNHPNLASFLELQNTTAQYDLPEISIESLERKLEDLAPSP